jgi:hypothetical protein
VKSFNTLKLPVILLSFSGALLLSPASKAQEASPDHFTDTGVQNVYEPGQAKVAAAAVKKMPAPVLARNQQIGSASTLQLATKRGSSLLAQPEAQVVAEKRKSTPAELKKP